MQSGWELSEPYARKLLELYTAAEQQALDYIAARALRGLHGPDWLTKKQLEVSQLRQELQVMVARLEREKNKAVPQAVAAARSAGAADAEREIAGLLGRKLSTMPLGNTAVQALTDSLSGKLSATHLRIVRWSEDVYQKVIANAAVSASLGAATVDHVARQAFKEFTRKGVTGFVDKAGRRWNLRKYANMASRTTVAQAARQGQLDRMTSVDLDLIKIDSTVATCDVCDPWENKILTQGATPVGLVTVPSMLDNTPISVTVSGTVDDARRAGLFHPNCTHVVSAFIPGVTAGGAGSQGGGANGGPPPTEPPRPPDGWEDMLDEYPKINGRSIPFKPSEAPEITDENWIHILDGEPGDLSKGGHRFGADREDKTQFPPEWDDDYIKTAVILARQYANPDAITVWKDRYTFKQVIDRVGIVVIAQLKKGQWESYAFPAAGPGVSVIKNGVRISKHRLPDDWPLD